MAVLIITAIMCFIIEPVLALAGLYQPLKWKYYYSFPVYAAMAIGIRVLVVKLDAVNEKFRNRN